MSLVRALLRSPVTDLTVVSYGGPDVGLLCAAGKIRKLVYGFVSLDSIPLEPHFRAARQNGTIAECVEYDEGMLQWALYAGVAAAAVPADPGRSRQRRDGRQPVAAHRHIALRRRRGAARRAGDPARRRVRPPQPSRRARQRPVPRARPLLRRPVPRRVRAGPALRVVRAHRRPPTRCCSTEGSRSTRCAINRVMVDGVIEAPNGAHFTTCEPDYGRDEAFQKAYVDGRRRPDDVGRVRRPVPRPGRRPTTRRPIGAGRRRSDETRCRVPELADVVAVACAEAFRGDGEIFASGMGTMPMLGARLARATFEPDLLVSATARRSSSPATCRSAARMQTRSSRAGSRSAVVFDTLWGGRRHVMMGATQIDRFGNSNIANIGPWERPKAQLLGVRGGPGQHDQPRHQLLDPEAHAAGVRRAVDMVQRHRLRPCGARSAAAVRRHHRLPRVDHQPGRARLRRSPDHSMRLRQRPPRGQRRRGRRRRPGSSSSIADDIAESRARRPTRSGRRSTASTRRASATVKSRDSGP